MRLLFAGFCLGVLFTVTSQSASASQNSQILDSNKTGQQALSKLPQWDRVYKSYQRQLSLPATGRVAKWLEFIESIKEESPIRQLLKVNLWFNGYPYKQDNWLYGKDDHWATPAEFLQNGGDCEDFVIIKYLTLRHLGFSPDNMKMVMVYDVFSGTDHSLLVVQHNDETYVMDNRDNMTIEDHYTERYKPHYAFNEKTVWTYQRPAIVKKIRKDENGTVMPGNR